MKVKVAFTVEVDQEAWAEAFGLAPSEVRPDVQKWCARIAQEHIRDQY